MEIVLWLHSNQLFYYIREPSGNNWRVKAGKVVVESQEASFSSSGVDLEVRCLEEGW